MNREMLHTNEIAQAFGDNANLPKQEAQRLTKIFLATVRELIEEGNDVRLKGICSITHELYTARQMNNFDSGEKMQIEDSPIIKVKVSYGLKQHMRNNRARYLAMHKNKTNQQ